jgi:hypothetical protein
MMDLILTFIEDSRNFVPGEVFEFARFSVLAFDRNRFKFRKILPYLVNLTSDVDKFFTLICRFIGKLLRGFMLKELDLLCLSCVSSKVIFF